MALPTPESVQKILASGGVLRKKILAVAKRLEALNEYHPEQALIVAADIVRTSLRAAQGRALQGVEK